MKVALLLTQGGGGPADLTMSLAQELAGRTGGPEITVVGPIAEFDGRHALVQLRTAHFRSKTDLSGFARVAKELQRLSPDVVHAQDRRAGLVASLAVGKRAKVVMTYHGVPDNAAGRWVKEGPLHGRRSGLSGGSRLLADALIARRVACTVAPSLAIAEFLHRELRVPTNRVRVLHNGVTLPPDRDSGSDTAVIGDVRTFTTVSSFALCKDTPLLVEAFMSLAATRPALRLRMVGDGDDRQRCEALVRAAHLEHQVLFTGYRSDVYSELRQADAFVLPSYNENLPLALLQAMAVGLPCIASDVGGVSEVLTEDCGVLVHPGDITSLTAAMTRFIDEPALAARLGAAARTRVTDGFNMARCADEHVQLWSELIHGDT